MDFSFVVNVSVSRSEGKFASRDELEEQFITILEEADPGSLEGENGGSYNVDDWAVEDNNQKPSVKVAKSTKTPAHDPLAPSPRWTHIIESWVNLNEEPESSRYQYVFAAAMDELLEAFPRVAQQAREKYKAAVAATPTD